MIRKAVITRKAYRMGLEKEKYGVQRATEDGRLVHFAADIERPNLEPQKVVLFHYSADGKASSSRRVRMIKMVI